jgi:hypothetical protein
VRKRVEPEKDVVPAVKVKTSVSGALQTMRELYAASRAAFDTNHPVEALRHLVGLLAVNKEEAPETESERSAERNELARKADAELTAIGARFTLEPTDGWISAGSQVSGSVRDLANGKGPFPSVRLVINYDAGKAVVADAPIRFGFIDGEGEVTRQALTDSYGVVSATVRSLSRTDRPAVIRAMLVVSNRGSTRAFPDVFRDFTYLPSRRTARVLASERSVAASGARAEITSPLVDAVSRGLAAADLEILPTSGDLDPSSFDAASSGDPASVAAALAGGTYLVLAVTEYEDARQMVNKGRTYGIYTVTARTRVRILNSDGSIAVSRPELRNIGRGGSAASALQTALAASRKAVEEELRAAGAEIRTSLR